jgi:hypothetical protein
MLHRVGGHATHSSTSVVRRIPKIRGRKISGRTERPPTKSAVGATVLRPKIKLTMRELYRWGYFRPLPLIPQFCGSPSRAS